jgi:hypothetical protein
MPARPFIRRFGVCGRLISLAVRRRFGPCRHPGRGVGAKAAGEEGEGAGPGLGPPVRQGIGAADTQHCPVAAGPGPGAGMRGNSRFDPGDGQGICPPSRRPGSPATPKAPVRHPVCRSCYRRGSRGPSLLWRSGTHPRFRRAGSAAPACGCTCTSPTCPHTRASTRKRVGPSVPSRAFTSRRSVPTENRYLHRMSPSAPRGDPQPDWWVGAGCGA